MEQKTIIIFGSADWDFLYQRSRALAEELGNLGHKVYFFEPLKPLAKSIYAFLKSGLKRPLKKYSNNENVEVISLPCISAFRGTVTPQIDKVLFNWQFLTFLKQNNISKATIIIAMSFWYDGLLDKKYSTLQDIKIIYDCIDELSVFARNEKILDRLRKREIELVKDCSEVICTASVLVEHIKKIDSNKKIHFLPNGAGVAHFLKALSDSNVSLPLLNKVPKPIVGFVGGIYSWVDLELIEYAAKELSDFSFVLVGPSKGVDLTPLQKCKNVFLLGPADYSLVPAYVKSFDCCLIPFKINDIILSTDPIKIYEYFSLKKPVVVTDFPEARKFKDILYIATNKADFVNKIILALDESDETNSLDERFKIAYESSWINRAKKLEAELL